MKKYKPETFLDFLDSDEPYPYTFIGFYLSFQFCQ